ncbi:MAG: M23 family metallopeptidase [Clostridiales bacterium]|nr:M23 family metallopeptidase [Clostridiales bacterium]
MVFEDYKPKKKKFGSKTFYGVMALGIIVLGIGVWSAVEKTPEVSFDTESQQYFDDTGDFTFWDDGIDYVPDEQANVTVTGVPDDRAKSEEITAETIESTDNVPFTGNFVLPLNSGIMKEYSEGEIVYSKTMGDWRVHTGTDFIGKQGEKVVAVQDGTVKRVYNDELWGMVMEIEHGGGLTVIYCGLSEGSTKSVGNTVEKGERIGLLGEIPVEQADGYHLHAEAKVNGTTQNFMKAINKVAEQ